MKVSRSSSNVAVIALRTDAHMMRLKVGAGCRAGFRPLMIPLCCSMIPFRDTARPRQLPTRFWRGEKRFKIFGKFSGLCSCCPCPTSDDRAAFFLFAPCNPVGRAGVNQILAEPCGAFVPIASTRWNSGSMRPAPVDDRRREASLTRAAKILIDQISFAPMGGCIMRSECKTSCRRMLANSFRDGAAVFEHVGDDGKSMRANFRRTVFAQSAS